MTTHPNNYPKLHNSMWPGLVGKGADSEPIIDLDTMLRLTAGAEVDGVKFDGVDVFLAAPHIDVDIGDDDLRRLADRIAGQDLTIGSIVAPVWPPTGGGSAMGDAAERAKFVQQVRRTCEVGQKLRRWGYRPYGIIRIDSACSPADWAKDPVGNQIRIAETFRAACAVADDHGERLAAEGEICWGGMHGWREMIDLLERVDCPGTIGFQADMAHTLLYALGYNAPQDRLLPEPWDWDDDEVLDDALAELSAALRPWIFDVHIAQNDATVKGAGSHDKTGRHCEVNDPNGKLDITRHARHWLRDDSGAPLPTLRHVCWDGCMFPNETMLRQETWNDVLGAMVAVRDAHGWQA